MNRFQKIMLSVMTVCGLVFVYFASRSDASWSQLGFAAIVLLGILLIPSSFMPAADNQKGEGLLDEMDDALRRRITQIVQQGRKIEAIKELRAATGLGLAEAKSIVDQIDPTHRAEVVDQ